jgi:hypothetical protein
MESPVEPAPSEPAGWRGWAATTWVLALAAALLPLWFHRQFANGDAIIYYGDAAQLQFPRYVTLCEALKRGEFPLWQTLVYGGSPFHANPENPTLYPPSLLFAALAGPGATINLTALVHLALAALGMFALARRLARRAAISEGPAAAGALLGATIFAFSQFTRRDHFNLVAYGAAHALIPWMLLAADAWLHGPRPRRSAGLLALAVAAIFFTGGLYVIPYAFLALALWVLGLGLLGGREERRRTLRLGVLVACAAGLLLCAKLLPYREWLPTTNRAGRLPVQEALGTSLGGTDGNFAWSGSGGAWERITRFLGGVWVLLPGVFALALLRHAFVRVTLGIALLGFAIGLGGAVWSFFYEYVPPFDQVRSAVRAWTLVNAFYPLLAGLGAAWVLQRLPLLWRGTGLTALIGLGLAIGYVPLLTSTDPREQALREPDKISELRTRYPRWSAAAQLAGDRWRVGSLDRKEAQGRNEQFATSLLGVETVSGYQGHVWPDRLARHLYPAPPTELTRDARMRRLGVLSARWLVETDPAIAPARDPAQTEPAGIEGTVLVENPYARERLYLPAVAIGVIGDVEGDLTRALIDHPLYPVTQAVLVELPDSGASANELAALDALLLLGEAPRTSTVRAHYAVSLPTNARVFELEALLPGAIEPIAAAAAELARSRKSVELAFERDGANRALLHVLTSGERERFAVASEPWAWYAGWRIEGMDPQPTLRVADGVASAFVLPPTPVRSPLVARCAPRSTIRGLICGALGLALALALCLWPEKA